MNESAKHLDLNQQPQVVYKVVPPCHLLKKSMSAGKKAMSEFLQ